MSVMEKDGRTAHMHQQVRVVRTMWIKKGDRRQHEISMSWGPRKILARIGSSPSSSIRSPFDPIQMRNANDPGILAQKMRRDPW